MQGSFSGSLHLGHSSNLRLSPSFPRRSPEIRPSLLVRSRGTRLLRPLHRSRLPMGTPTRTDKQTPPRRPSRRPMDTQRHKPIMHDPPISLLWPPRPHRIRRRRYTLASRPNNLYLMGHIRKRNRGITTDRKKSES